MNISQLDLDAALDAAIYSRQEDSVIQALLDRGACPNARDECGNPMLRCAYTWGHKSALPILLEAGADPNGRYEGAEISQTVLISATSAVDIPTVKLLLDKNADVDAKNETGMTALMVAVRTGSIELVEILLSHGADSHAVDNKGMSVYEMIRNPNKKQIRKLITKAQQGAML